MGRQNPNKDYFMKAGDTTLKIEDCGEEKDLGVTFDSKLSFDQHIQTIVSKANQMLGLIKRTFSYIDKDMFCKLYKALVRPHLEYANIIWHPHLKRQSVKIEKVQRRATKLVKECENMSYDERLHYLKLHSLKGRRIRGDLIQTYKIFNDTDNTDLHNLFQVSHITNTRNACGKLYLHHCNTNIRKYSYTFRVVRYWNSLPENTKFALTRY